MVEKSLLSEVLILNCLKSNYGIDVKHLISLPWGADINASVYKAQANDALYFVKLKRDHHHELSALLARFLHDAGILQIIPPMNTSRGLATQHIEDCTIIVYPFVEGRDGFSQDLTKAQWEVLGKAMRQVHEIEIPLSIQNQIRKESYSPKWRETVRSLLISIEGELIGDETTLKLLKYMRENKVLIHQLVERAEHLSQKLLQQSPKFVLCHSDIHAGNILIDNKGTLYIVDWDEPIMAPIERDLMFIGAGVGNVWNKPQEVQFFYCGYGSIDINQDCLAYYRCERIVEDIAIYGHELLLTEAGGEQREVMYQHFVDMFEPHGVVDIALKTIKL